MLNVTGPLGEGSAMDLLQRGINKALGSPETSDAKKEILNKILAKISSGDAKGALIDAKNQGIDFLKTKASDALDTIKAKVPGVQTAIDKLQGKIPDYKVLKKNLRSSIKKDLDKFKGFEEDPADNPYSPRNFLASLKNDNATNDAQRLKNRIRNLQTKKDLGLMNEDQEEAFDKLQSKLSKLRELKLNPPSDIDAVAPDTQNAAKSALSRIGQARAKVLEQDVQPTMQDLSDRAQQRLKLLNENFGTEGSAGAGVAKADESQVVPMPSKPAQDPAYLAEVKKIKAKAGEKLGLAEDEPEIEEGLETAESSDFSPVGDVIGLGISLAGIFGGFNKHTPSIPKAPIPSQSSVQIGANQA